MWERRGETEKQLSTAMAGWAHVNQLHETLLARRAKHQQKGHFCPTCNAIAEVRQAGVITTCQRCNGGCYNLEAVNLQQVLRDLHVARQQSFSKGKECQEIYRQLDLLGVQLSTEQLKIVTQIRDQIQVLSGQSNHPSHEETGRSRRSVEI